LAPCYGSAVQAGLQFGLLGPLEVRLEDGDPVSLGGLRQRALLAILALHPNQVVSTDQLVDELWGERPPATAVHTVQVFVSRLRGALGPAGERLVTRPPGYVLELGIDEVDAGRCERMYSDAQAALGAGDAAEAATLLRDAMALWRGPPLADFTYEPFAQSTIARLDELRLSCREELIEAELALGRHSAVVSDLEALVREQPFRERPWGQLMLALYRSGRQAEALDTFQKARRALVEELGVEPSAALRALERAILQQDDSLRAPTASAGRDVEPSPAAVEDVSEAAPPALTLLRKTATVLVARIEAASDADPERTRTLVQAARDQAKAIVSGNGGTFVAGLGGELVAVFGLPVSREDDALRALRAADEVRMGVTAIAGGELAELVTRVGVDTGEVVADGDDLFGEPLTAGLSLARAAGEGEVIMSDATRRLASDGIRAERAPEGTGWCLLGLVAGAPIRAIHRESPMVGREAELSAARAAFGLAAGSGTAHLLTVLGDAGIGKSRLCDELVDALRDEAVVLRGRCLSYGEGIAFWPLREAVTEAAGGGSPEAVLALLGDAGDAQLVADIVAGALGLSAAEGIGEQVQWAFRRLLEAMARQRPLLLVIDDAHWADEPLLDLVDYLVDWLTAPTLLICLARPDLLELRPAWGGGHSRVRSLVLAPLGQEDAARLLDNRLGDRSLSPADSARILDAAEGNPLFVEQLLAASAEDPWWSERRSVPGTLHALLAARLDRLGPGERAVIERAAVIGRAFWPAAVVEMLPQEAQASADQHLRRLVHRGLIHPKPTSSVGQEELRFQHMLIRDVAYRSTPKALRGELHEKFADWLAPRAEGAEEFVGYHLEQAVAYRSEIGPGDSLVARLAVRGGECLAVAGRQALARGDAQAGVKLLRRAASLFHTGGVLRPDVSLDLGAALGETGDFREMERVLQTALEESQSSGAEALGARSSIELSYQRALVDPGFRVGEMLAVAQDAMTVFSRIGDEAGLARALEHMGEVHWTLGHCAEMEEVLERALDHAERAGDPLGGSRILTMLAAATVFGPRSVPDGIRRCAAILDRAQDDLRLTAVTETMLAVQEAMTGDFAQARARWSRSQQRLEDVGLEVTAATLGMYRAFIELMAGTPRDAEPDLAAAYAVLEEAGERSRLATIAALLARLLYEQGRYDEVERYSVISEEASSEDDVASQVVWRGTRAKALARAGDGAAGEELASSAVALAGATDMLMFHADALRDRAEVMSLVNRPAEALRDLESAIELYERKGASVAVSTARRLHSSLAPSGQVIGSGET
jgi:DNA-binding SARP family transcriptional activator